MGPLPSHFILVSLLLGPSILCPCPYSAAHQCEECAEAGDGPEGCDVTVHVLVLSLCKQRVLALDPTALHVLVPALGVVCPHQGCFALA